MQTMELQLWSQPTHGDHYFNKLKSTLSQNSSTQFPALFVMIFYEIFKDYFYIHFCVKFGSKLLPHLFRGSSFLT